MSIFIIKNQMSTNNLKRPIQINTKKKKEKKFNKK